MFCKKKKKNGRLDMYHHYLHLTETDILDMIN